MTRASESDPSRESPRDDAPRVLPVTDRWLTLPNVLSLIRLAGIPLFIYLLVEPAYGWAALVLMLAGITDYLDGKIARRFGWISKLGQRLDPISDRLFIAASVLGLAAVEVIPWWFVILLFARDAAILAMYPTVRRHRLPIPQVHFVGKAATFNLLAACPLILLGHVDGWWSTAMLAIGWSLAWWGVSLYWIAGLIYGWQVRALLALYRVPDARASI